MRAIVIFATLTAVVLARPDVSHLNGYKYNQPGGGASNAASNSFSNAGAGFSGGNNELESLNNLNNKGNNLEELSSTFMGFTSYDAPYVSGNNYQGSYTDSASFGSSAAGVTSGAPLEEVSVQVSSSASVNGVASSGFAPQSTGLDAAYQSGSNGVLSGGNGLSGGSNGNSGSSNGYSGSSNGFSGSSNGFSGSSNGFSGSSNGFSAGSNGASNGFVSGSESTGAGFSGATSGSNGAGFSGASTGSNGAGFSGASSGSNGASNGGINLIQGQSQSFDLTGGSNGGQRVVYKPVIKQGEPIITKNFYVHAAPEEDENVRVEEKVHVVRPQKTYKIIFIKAPSAGPSLSAANYPVYPQNEEKTIVYVLSKKNDDVSDIGEIPTPPPAVTHKPEVFFIKYKTRQEAADAVANIQSQLHQESQSDAPTGVQSLSIGGTGNGNDGSNLVITSSGSSNEAGLDQRITPDDIRDESGDIDESAFGVSAAGDLGGSGIQTITTSSASSETRVGPSGAQFGLQASNFGPTGGQVITQTAQIPAGDALPAVQTQYTEYNGGQTYTQQQQQAPAYSPDSSGSSAEFIPQQFIKIDPNQSTFNNRQAYLPPNARRFRF